MKIKKVPSYDETLETHRSILSILQNLFEAQESYDEVCSELSPDLLGCMARFVTRINGNLICRDGKEWMLFNGDCFVPVPLWVVVWCIEHLLSTGLSREATLLGVSRGRLETLADKVGIERATLKGKAIDKVLGMLKSALVADSHLSPSEAVAILTELNELADNNTASKMLQTLSKKVRDGSPFNSLLKQLPQARGIYRQIEELNADGYLLVCKQRVTLDLRKIDTPELMARASSQFDLNTQCVNAVYNPLAVCPKFREQFHHIFDNPDVRSFAQMFMGTSVDGSRLKELMAILHGPPGTGKSVLAWSIANTLGDYAVSVDGSFFLKNVSRGKGDTTPHLVKIIGKRLVVAAEPDGNAVLDEEMIKRITGDPKIDYRDLYSSEKSFMPVCTMFMTANRLPKLSGNDSAITNRRLATYQCRGQISYEKMKDTATFSKELEQENSGILNFLLEGYRNSVKHARLPIPDVIREEIQQYQHTHDIVEQFFSEVGILADMHNPEKGVSVSDLYKKYVSWCTDNGNTHPMTTNRFSPLLVSKGFKQAVAKVESKATRVWLGVQLPQVTTPKKPKPASNGHTEKSDTATLSPVTVSIENDLSDLKDGNF